MTKLTIFCALALSGLSCLGACGRYTVRPDEKEFLADRIMQPDYEQTEQSIEQHILTNREGASGGYGAAGGGCGCN